MQYTEPGGLPEPDAVSQAHSRKVGDFIAGKIHDAGGSISFAEFMQHALYAPGLGYYAAGAAKFGEEGDFVTAPEISSVFGRVVARQVAEVLGQLDGGDVLEFGAGSGKLAVDMLLMLQQLDALPARYRILEVSADLQQRQARRLREQAGQIRVDLHHLDHLVELLALLRHQRLRVDHVDQILEAGRVEEAFHPLAEEVPHVPLGGGGSPVQARTTLHEVLGLAQVGSQVGFGLRAVDVALVHLVHEPGQLRPDMLVELVLALVELRVEAF